MSFLKTPWIHDLWQQRFLVMQMLKREFQNKYIGSSLGTLWSLIQPLVMILILWLVFTKGFNAGPIGVIPFIAWLTGGIIVWDFFSTTLTSSVNVFGEYQYLVKKVKFKLFWLPLIKISVSLINHAILIGIAIGIFLLSGIEISVYWLQTLYYLFSSTICLLGLVLITASLQVFYKDMAQIINIFLQFGFWGTPILWHYQMLPQKWIGLIEWNPVFYITEGYRNSFFGDIPIWHSGLWTLKFWIVTALIYAIGYFLFRRLSPHFSDVL